MLARVVSLIMLLSPALVAADEPIVPSEVISLFNGRDLTGLTTWLKETGRDDPLGVYSAREGLLRISGEGAGYIATGSAYRDYRLVVEYKWGDRTDGSKFVRNSGILLHAVGPDGNRGGVWMTSFECQLAQGCEGDIIVIRGTDDAGQPVAATCVTETVIAADGRTRWQPGGQRTPYRGRQFWWSKHEPGFAELRDTRGKEDVASPLGEWTRVECLCRGDRITVRINGVTVNEIFECFPAGGKILLQNEGNEVFFRRFELHPLPVERQGCGALNHGSDDV